MLHKIMMIITDSGKSPENEKTVPRLQCSEALNRFLFVYFQQPRDFLNLYIS